MKRVSPLEAIVGVGLLAALIVGNGYLTFRNTGQVRDDTRLVAHTHKVLDLSTNVLLTVVDAETGQRGYLLTGKDQFLKPFNDALAKLDGQLKALRESGDEHPRRQDRIAAMEKTIAERVELLREGIALRNKSAAEAAAFVSAEKGKAVMDSLRDQIAQMEDQERALLREREERSHSAFRVAVGTGVVGTLLGLLLVFAVAALVLSRFRLRARAAQAVHQEREHLRVTLASIGDGVIATDADGKVTFLNPIAQALTGWSETDARGKPLDEVFRIVNESTRQPVDNPALRALREGVIVGLANHTLLLALDGTERPIDDSAAPIRGALGSITGSVLVFRDITERKRSEIVLDERMRLLALSAEVGAALVAVDTFRDALQHCAAAMVKHLDGAFARIWILNRDDNVLELQASAGLYTHLDGPHARIPVGQFKIGWIAQERRVHLTNAVVGDSQIIDQEWARREGIVSFAGYPLLVDDQLVGVLALFSRRPLASHTFEGTAAVARQVALGIERKRSALEVARLLALEQERSDRLREVAAASLTINSATTPSSVVGVFRAEAGRIIDARQAEVILEGESITPPVGGLAAPLIGRAGRPLGNIYLAEKADGPFTEDDRAILAQLAHMAAVAIDNARLYEEMREDDRRKDEFLATLAHELRNPLAPIRNSLQVMRLAADDPDAMEESRAMIERQMLQMVRLVDDLLDLSRISRGKLELRVERTDLATVLDSAIETSLPLVQEYQHTLAVDLPEDLVPLDGDAVRLSQIFLNLLNNAAKYTPRGGRIELSARRHGDRVTVRVRDNGVGIAPEMLPRVFEMFTQADRSLERSQGGLGIGLTLVQRLVEMHHGTVRAFSDGVGKGSEFVVELPVASLVAALRRPGDSDFDSLRKHRRILVVDDNRDSADSMAKLLRMLGNDVVTAYDGLEAVDQATTFQPEIVLLDLGLPRLNGYDAARRIREQPGGAKRALIALTGWGQQEDRRRTAEAGFDHHLVKPIDLGALQSLLGQLKPD
jgi:PAS domain S-box-containing protein